MSDATIQWIVMTVLATIPVIWGLVRATKNDKQAVRDKADERSDNVLYKIIDELQEENTRRQEENIRLRAVIREKNGVTKTDHAPASPGARKS